VDLGLIVLILVIALVHAVRQERRGQGKTDEDAQQLLADEGEVR
jgi:hypothetical protein